MIAYYAHSHGSGHSRCAENLAKSNPSQSIILTDAEYSFDKQLTVIQLENEDVDGSELYYNREDQPKYVHYSPVGLKKIMRRSRKIIDAILSYDVQLLIVDVSVEVAALARASSIPYAYRRMSGNRNDTAHLEAYRGALFLIAYYPESFEDINTPQWVKEKTCYLGFTSLRRKSLHTIKKFAYDFAIIQGFGGEQNTSWILKKLVQYRPDASIVVVGPVEKVVKYNNIEYTGPVSDITPYLKGAGTIIASCGSNLSKEIMDEGRRFLAVPERRPYDEQHLYARTLERNGLAIELTKENFPFAIEASKTFEPVTVPPQYYCEPSSAYKKIIAQLQKYKRQYHATA